MNGILLVDKPTGLTSHDVVSAVRRVSGFRRIGHTGTLDPAATGLLILCLGPATRLSEFLTGLDKVYEGSMRLGIVTDSYDLDGKTIAERPVPELSESDIEAAFAKFTGDIMQIPPMVSAVKVRGERLYKLARKGEVVERQPRPVTVSEFRLLRYEAPNAHFRIRCTRGTYARALAYDVGELLGCGATLAALRRTWVGPHCVDNAVTLDALSGPEDVARRLLPTDRALDLPQIVLRRGYRRMAGGNALGPSDIEGVCPVQQGWVQVKTHSGELVALADVQSTPAGLRFQPKRILGQ